MRSIIIDISERPRPSLVTPTKGTEGDMVDETQASACSIDAIIKRYGGTLPAAKGWPDGGVQLPLNRDELEAMAYNACEDIVNNGGKAPLIKCVIYGVGNMAYQNSDGVYVFPITALKD